MPPASAPRRASPTAAGQQARPTRVNRPDRRPTSVSTRARQRRWGQAAVMVARSNSAHQVCRHTVDPWPAVGPSATGSPRAQQRRRLHRLDLRELVEQDADLIPQRAVLGQDAAEHSSLAIQRSPLARVVSRLKLKFFFVQCSACRVKTKRVGRVRQRGGGAAPCPARQAAAASCWQPWPKCAQAPCHGHAQHADPRRGGTRGSARVPSRDSAAASVIA